MFMYCIKFQIQRWPPCLLKKKSGETFHVVKTHPYIQIISSIKKNTYLVEEDLRQAWTLEKAL